MRAYKCDRCGKFFEKYDGQGTDKFFSLTHIIPCTMGDCLDLCPNCNAELQAWVTNDKEQVVCNCTDTEISKSLAESDDNNILIVIDIPKEHGRLSDMDELTKNIVKGYGVNSVHELPQDIKMFYYKFIYPAPTILDATFNYKLKNYAFFSKGTE